MLGLSLDPNPHLGASFKFAIAAFPKYEPGPGTFSYLGPVISARFAFPIENTLCVFDSTSNFGLY